MIAYVQKKIDLVKLLYMWKDMQNVQHMYNGIIMDSRASYTFKIMDNFTIQAYS